EGNLLFAVGGTQVYAIDVSNTSRPKLNHSYIIPISGIGGLSLSLSGVASKGDYVFVTGTREDMRILQYSAVDGFSFIHSTGWSVSTSFDPVVYGNYLFYYTSSFDKGLAVMDISSPDKFSTLSTPLYPEYFSIKAIHGNLGFVTNVTDSSNPMYRVDIVDLSNPLSLVPIASLDLPSWVVEMAVTDSQMNVLTKYADIQVADYSQLKAPTLVGSYTLDGNSGYVSVEGSIAYLSQYSTGIQLIDLSDPTQPKSKSRIKPVNLSTYGVVSRENKAYVLDGDLLRIFDVSDTSAPVFLGDHKVTSLLTSDAVFTQDVDVSNNVAFVTFGTEMEILDVSQASNVQLLGRHTSSNRITNVRVYGNLAYVANLDGIEILDVSNASVPKVVGLFPQSSVYDVIVRGGVAYVASFSGLYILDVSNPAKISQLSFTTTIGYIRSIALKENFLFVGDTYTGVQVFDVSKPGNPTVVGKFAKTSVPSIGVLANYFLTTSTSGLAVVENLSDKGSGGGPGPGPNPDSNQAPIANAGSNQTVKARELVTLNGAGSYDPDGDTLSYQWKQTGGRNVSLSDSTSVSPTFTAPKYNRKNNTLMFELTVSDGSLSATDTVTITIAK
ncbi:MAG: PKD domain-containing protein, partial [Gammaproteobacteria bacterium]|nr:PKD domain-containing protein [Gammaproteobacteria bacterium]